MDMKRILIVVILCMALCWIAGAAYGQQTSSDSLPSPAVFFKFGLTGIFGDQQYLYIMAGGKIMQYEAAEMTLLRSVDLPEPTLPAPPPKVTDAVNFPPPPPLPHGLWVGNNSLYVLAGLFIYTYSVPDLTLQNTVQLPKPELPK
jgi:hypothetical protein